MRPIRFFGYRHHIVRLRSITVFLVVLGGTRRMNGKMYDHTTKIHFGLPVEVRNIP